MRNINYIIIYTYFSYIFIFESFYSIMPLTLWIPISGLLAVTNCLDSGDIELLVVCCGVLVNMTSDENNRQAFKNYNGVSKMVNILRSSGERNWTLSSLICQTLWNVCSDSDSFPGDPIVVLDTLVKLTGRSCELNKNLIVMFM